MTLKERIDLLNRKCGIKTYVELLIKIHKKLNSDNPYEEAEKDKSNFTQMLQENRPLKKEYYIPLEQIYNVTMDYILNGEGTPNVNYRNGGIRYTASTNDYKEFERLGSELTADDLHVIFNFDEYEKTIMDYIVEYDAMEGLRYLIDHFKIKYDQSINAIITKVQNHYCHIEDISKLFDMIIEKDDAKVYSAIFDSFDTLIALMEDSIYANKGYFKKILSTNEIFESTLEAREIPLIAINHGLVDNEVKSLFINPLINELLPVALEDPVKYKDKIEKIVDFALEKNKEIIDYILTHYSDIKGDYKIDKQGYILVGYTRYGMIVVPDDIINPSLDEENKEKIEKLKTINNRILYHDVKDYFGNNHKAFKRNEYGHFIKLASNNECEYELHKEYEGKLPIPKYYGKKDGIDEFSCYRGKIEYYGGGGNIEHATEIAKFLRLLHDMTEKDGSRVYVHGDIGADNFYFTDGKLTDVVNWDKCKLGDIYEDMVNLLIRFSGLAEKYRENKKVVEYIKKIFNAYNASKEYKAECIKRLKKQIDDKLKDFNNKEYSNDEQRSSYYEYYMWCKSFIDMHYDQIQQ